MDKPWQLPSKNDWFEWLRYIILSVMNLAVIAVFVFANVVVIGAGLSKDQSAERNDDAKTTNKIFYTIVAFGIVVGKIILMVFFGVALGMREDLQRDPAAILPWFVISFFGIITIGTFLIFRFVLKKFSSARRALQSGSMDIFVGKVADKNRVNAEASGSMARQGEIFCYSFTLDSGKSFENVQPGFYHQVEIGQRIEVHAIPYVGEILHIYRR